MPSSNDKKGRFLNVLKNRPVCSALSESPYDSSLMFSLGMAGRDEFRS